VAHPAGHVVGGLSSSYNLTTICQCCGEG
jgi:hypothetical protein